MGKKGKEKAKEKKAALKAQMAQVNASQSIVAAANALEDPLQPFTPFQKYDRNSLKISVSCHRVTTLPVETTDWIFDLTKRNMQTFYDGCEWGWKDRDRQQELTEEAAWYLLCKDDENKNVAYVHFRFDLDEDIEVLYIHEIQMEKEVRRKGLGKFLVTLLTLMAKKYEMQKVMCTVFLQNQDSVIFFKECCRFELDETSPEFQAEPSEPTLIFYQILSKKFNPTPPKVATTEPLEKLMDCCAINPQGRSGGWKPQARGRFGGG